MRNSKFYLLLITMVALLLPAGMRAQENTINTFSVYSMYGLGELQSQGTLATRSLAGAGVAMRSYSTINLLNPASYSMALRKGILLDFGVEGSSYFASQKVGGETLSSGYTTANFHNVALQMPIAKRFGFGFSVTPYSDVGYRQLDSTTEPSLGYVKLENSGSGTVTEVKAGFGWEVLDGLSVGFAAQYYWGDINRTFSATVVNMSSTTTPESLYMLNNISVSSIKGQFGLQAEVANNEKRKITAGLTLDIGGDLHPRYVRMARESSGYTSVYAQSDTVSGSIILPRQVTAGVEYSTNKVQIMADVNYQGWANQNATVEITDVNMKVEYNNFLTGRLGVQYTPKPGDVRHYFNRVNYRFGARYGGYQYTYGGEAVSQYAVTTGMGLPLKVMGISKIDLGLEWGGIGSMKQVQVGSESVGLVKQNYLKFQLGFTLFGDDYWFQRPQID